MKRLWKSLKLQDGKIVSDYDCSEWIIGEWRTVPKPKQECIGLNCCENIVDAMGYVAMEVLAQVEIKGEKIVGTDKITSEKMRIVKAWKWEKKDSVALAVYSSELCIENFEKFYPNNNQPRAAIESAKAWLGNSCLEMESAAESAGSAAGSAAWSAESAAESAARSATESAWSAAGSATESARSATESARLAESAESAAESAARSDIQNWIETHIPELEELRRAGEP